MSTSTSPPIASRHIPFLPNELISQILQSPRLSKSDLARCCLVNRRVLSMSQRRLYSTFRLEICSIDGLWTSEWVYSARSQLFLRTLEANVLLSSTVLGLRIKTVPFGEEPASSIDGFALEDALSGPLRVLPRLKSLDLDKDLWRQRSTKDFVYSAGHRWEGLNIRAGTVLRKGKRWSTFPNLKELDCTQLSLQVGYDDSIPNSLEVLKIKSNRPETLRGSPGSRLKVLHVVGSPETVSHIGDFPDLQYLHIFRGLECQPLLPSSAFSTFSQLAHLRSLSLALWSVGDPTLTATLPSLLTHLPPSLDRLDFPERTPLKTLSTYFKLEMSPPFRFLGYSPSKYQDQTEKHMSITAVSVSGWLRGFQVEHIGR